MFIKHKIPHIEVGFFRWFFVFLGGFFWTGFKLLTLPGTALLTERKYLTYCTVHMRVSYLPTVFGGPIVLATAPSPKNRTQYDKRVNERN
jgi:hypothetical protein